MKFTYTIITAFILLSSNSSAQSTTAPTIKLYSLSGVNSHEDAKKALHVLSKCFDEMPEYDFETKKLKVISSIKVSLQDLNARLIEYGIILTEENNPNEIIIKN